MTRIIAVLRGLWAAIKTWFHFHQHHLASILLMLIAALLAYAVVESSYDWQAIKLVFLRLNIWFLAVTFYAAAKSLIEDDDYEADWERINSGNVAVAVYRAVAFGAVAVAAGMLVGKI